MPMSRKKVGLCVRLNPRHQCNTFKPLQIFFSVGMSVELFFGVVLFLKNNNNNQYSESTTNVCRTLLNNDLKKKNTAFKDFLHSDN